MATAGVLEPHIDIQLSGTNLTWSFESIAVLYRRAAPARVASSEERSPLRALYARLASEYDALPSVRSRSGGLPGEVIELQAVPVKLAQPLYLSPKPGKHILQGDIYKNVPSTVVEMRPLRAARPFQRRGDHDLWGVHDEKGRAPQGGFKWAIDRKGEEATLVRGYLGMAMVVSHDCEIESDPRTRTLAMIRPIDHLDGEAQERLLSGVDDEDFMAILPLEAQDEAPKMELSFVDFRRLTTVRPAVLEGGTRYASLSEELRRAVARRFWLYLFRRVEAEGSG